MVALVLALVLALGVSSACATAPRSAPATVELERTVLDLRAKNGGNVRRIEELENRIFILEDQLDSRKLAAEQQSAADPADARASVAGDTRPAIAIHPAPPGEPVRASLEEGAASSDTSIVAEQAVDYAGDAAQPGAASISLGAGAGSRPMLRLSAPEPLPDGRPVALPRYAAADPLKIYRQALEMLRAGQQALALTGFRRFLDGNPQHDYADNAQYWIGECYYDLRQWKTAEREFRKVVERYPRGNKVPDAMLKLGFTLQVLGDETGGRAVLESLARAFPKHEAARLAIDRLAHPEPGLTPGGHTPTLGTILPSSLSVPTGGAGGVPR